MHPHKLLVGFLLLTPFSLPSSAVAVRSAEEHSIATSAPIIFFVGTVDHGFLGPATSTTTLCPVSKPKSKESGSCGPLCSQNTAVVLALRAAVAPQLQLAKRTRCMSIARVQTSGKWRSARCLHKRCSRMLGVLEACMGHFSLAHHAYPPCHNLGFCRHIQVQTQFVNFEKGKSQKACIWARADAPPSAAHEAHAQSGGPVLETTLVIIQAGTWKWVKDKKVTIGSQWTQLCLRLLEPSEPGQQHYWAVNLGFAPAGSTFYFRPWTLEQDQTNLLSDAGGSAPVCAAQSHSG